MSSDNIDIITNKTCEYHLFVLPPSWSLSTVCLKQISFLIFLIFQDLLAANQSHSDNCDRNYWICRVKSDISFELGDITPWPLITI